MASVTSDLRRRSSSGSADPESFERVQKVCEPPHNPAIGSILVAAVACSALLSFAMSGGPARVGEYGQVNAPASPGSGDTPRRLKGHFGAWMTGPFGKCSSGCPIPVKTRKIECVSFYTGTPTHQCNHIEPVATIECSCDLEECVNESLSDCTPSPEEHPPSSVGSPSIALYANVGCFGLMDDDTSAAGDTNDLTCMDYAGPNLCRSGLPFFRNTSTTALTGDGCAHFCFGMGLDIFGIVEEKECRCGASVLNGAVWHGEDARPKLMFDMAALTPKDKLDVCPMEVFRFTGIYNLDSLPLSLLRPNLATSAYIDSIVKGEVISAAAEEDKANESVADMMKAEARRQQSALSIEDLLNKAAADTMEGEARHLQTLLQSAMFGASEEEEAEGEH